MGNKFLSHIRETQAIIHVIRCFENPDITHVHDQVDPVIDLETVETELLLSDIETLSNALIRLEKASRYQLYHPQLCNSCLLHRL